MNALDLIGTRPYKEESENQYSLRCPCHEDNNASLAIKQDGDRVLIHCFAGCLWSDVATALGGIERGSFSKGVTSPTPKVVHGPPLPPLSLDLIEPLPQVAKEWITKHRCISEYIQQSVGMGAARGRVALPIWDDGKIVDIRGNVGEEGRDCTPCTPTEGRRWSSVPVKWIALPL